MTQKDYVERLRGEVAKYGLSEYARMLGVDRRRLHREISGAGVEEKTYRNHDRNCITEAMGLRRVHTIHYEPVPGGPSDPAARTPEPAHVE